ncbi:MAG TPA: ABC transporter ATP-binding protein [Vicinamibacterales bacterium]|nr:ABC transporter ATP-binding protein [Vicinamibacterales bacterium]
MTPPNEPVLSVRDLSVVFDLPGGVATAVDAVSFDIAGGETLGLVGESGSGKSVTALSIVRLLRAPGRVSSGHLHFAGRDLRALGERDMRTVRGRGIGFVFQEPMTALDPVYTVGDQIIEAITVQGAVSRREARVRAVALLEAVRIPDAAARVNDYPHQLSGGMRQRVCIAIAIACRPRLLIADEPTTALDVTIQAEILDLLREMRRSLGLAMLLITHDLGVVAEAADRIAVMYAGRIVEMGPVRDVLRDPQHPYTRGLLASLPGTGRDRLQPIDGSVPVLGAFPRGCTFHPRCPDRFEPCDGAVPGACRSAPDRMVRCFLHEAGRAQPPGRTPHAGPLRDDGAR